MRLWVWEWVASPPALYLPLVGDKAAHTFTRTLTPPPVAASVKRSIHDPCPCGCAHTNTCAQLVCCQTMTHAIHIQNVERVKIIINWNINLLPTRRAIALFWFLWFFGVAIMLNAIFFMRDGIIPSSLYITSLHPSIFYTGFLLLSGL